MDQETASLAESNELDWIIIQSGICTLNNLGPNMHVRRKKRRREFIYLNMNHAHAYSCAFHIKKAWQQTRYQNGVCTLRRREREGNDTHAHTWPHTQSLGSKWHTQARASVNTKKNRKTQRHRMHTASKQTHYNLVKTHTLSVRTRTSRSAERRHTHVSGQIDIHMIAQK